MIYGVARKSFPMVELLMNLHSNLSLKFRHQQAMPPLPFFLFTHTFTLTHWVFDKPGNGAVEMFSRQTMHIRPYPQGDTVNGLNHQQNLQRGVCVCAYAWVSNTNMPPASCKQIRKLQKNKQSAGKI